jgi:hypothetical protein
MYLLWQLILLQHWLCETKPFDVLYKVDPLELDPDFT